MRVLFVANPERAHVLAMVPLAWALRTAGHEVRFAGAPWFSDVVTQAGLTAVPVGRDYDLWELLRRSMHTVEDWSYRPEFGLPAPYDVVQDPERADWRHLTEGYAGIIHQWHKPATFPMTAALVRFARAWRPDLVLWEPLAMAGPLAAQACGAAHGRLLWSVDAFGRTREEFLRLRDAGPPAERSDPLAEWLGGHARLYGGDWSEDLATGHFTIDQLPASLRPASALPTLPMRFVPYGGPAVVPRWLWGAPQRPRVALTMGISSAAHGAGHGFDVQDVLDSLADLDVEVVATVGEEQREELSRVPDNARLVSYVPLHALAPTCDLAVHHAGYGTFLTMAQHAVPQLLLPWDFDGPTLGRLAAAQGGSLAIGAERATAASVREAVVRLLGEPGFRERAAALREESLAQPAPNELVPRLEELTAAFRSSARRSA
ncbi:activator-dependent family glycosyltransferase [Streptomyces sp. NPDC048352]|uniref:activator-dependent family glycosyltransferase n=1 Tax=Streptomyces sp. NPDC048352 TaxID=3154718 RepID=UPI00341ECA1C